MLCGSYYQTVDIGIAGIFYPQGANSFLCSIWLKFCQFLPAYYLYINPIFSALGFEPF
jgi:hypothetical protein